MQNKIILKASCFNNNLTEEDKLFLQSVDTEYNNNLTCKNPFCDTGKKVFETTFCFLGKEMQKYIHNVSNIHVLPFESSFATQSEISRIISKLRNACTPQQEFVYYTQKSYEILFKHIFLRETIKKHYQLTQTPVDNPFVQYAPHSIANIDEKIKDTVMCVLLRGALLPSMIFSKEIEEYSSNKYITPFALFKIKRDETETDTEYILDIDKSFFTWESLSDKHLIFADPMNATGNSFLTVIDYIKTHIQVKSISFLNVIASMKGLLSTARNLPDCHIYTLWVDPALNHQLYILPGLGDAGDRINGNESPLHPRNILQLIADYGSNIAGLYRSQLREIEKTVLKENY